MPTIRRCDEAAELWEELMTPDADPFLIEGPARVAFSGGRTSGYMLHRMRQAYGSTWPRDVWITFANTGREFEETLRFVKRCQDEWRLPIRWVEYARSGDDAVRWKGKLPQIGCHGFREVTFETASRNGEPFDAIIEAKADFRREAKGEEPILPNATDRWCSGEMKHRTMDRFLKTELPPDFEDDYTVAVGLRADEPRRVSRMIANSGRGIEYVCPLAAAGVVLDDVMRFWRSNSFDLELTHDETLGTYQGNCDLCFLKANAKLNRLVEENPERVEWWAEKERQTGANFRRGRTSYTEMLAKRQPLEVLPGDCDLDVCLCTD